MSHTIYSIEPSDSDNKINLRFEADFEEDDTTTENPIFSFSNPTFQGHRAVLRVENDLIC